MDIFFSEIMPVMAAATGSILTTLLMIGMRNLNAWIRARVDSERMETALIQLSEAVTATVMDIEAEVRKFMSDGKLSRGEQIKLKTLARARVKKIAPGAINALARAGIEDIETYINGKIEDAVALMPKRLEPAVNG